MNYRQNLANFTEKLAMFLIDFVSINFTCKIIRKLSNSAKGKYTEKLRLKYILLKMHKTKRKISCNFIIFN